jgi:phosphatidylglycerol:prolipoprotein diacylglycerol transferase
MSLLRSGGVFYGGLIAASLTCIYQLRKHKLPLWQSGDLFAPGIALGYMVGRLGCLAAGCCYGKPAPGLAWAVTFTDPAAALNVGTPLNVPLHPTQLYESIAGLVILLTLLAIEKRGRSFPGRTFWQFVLMYAVSRFIIEFFRGDDRGMVSMFSTSQIISLVLAPLSIVMLWWLAGHATTPAGAPAVKKRRAF